MSDFGDLRSLLHNVEPSHEAFDALIATFRQAHDPDEVERVWLPYALERLDLWPDDTRTLLLSEGDPDADGGPGPYVALARVLDVLLSWWSEAQACAFFGSTLLASVASLFVSDLSCPECVFEQLARSPHLGRLRALTVYGAPSDAGLEAFMESGLPLEVLSFQSCRVEEASIFGLVRSETMKTLRELTLHDCGITDRGVVSLSRAEAPHLMAWDLSSNELSERAVFALADAKSQPLLESLSLSGNHVGDAALAALARSGRLERCRVLCLRDASVGDPGAMALSSMPDVSCMRVLDLNSNAIRRAGVQAIASRTWPNLSQLDLASNQLDDVGMIALLRAEGFEDLSMLDLSLNTRGEELPRATPEAFRVDESNPWVPYRSGDSFHLNLATCGLTEEFVVALAHTKRLETITALTLDQNILSFSAVRALGASPWLPQLSSLFVRGCRLDDDRLAALFAQADSGRFANLERLGLVDNALEDASASVLAGAGLVRLRELSMRGNLIGPGWAERFVETPDFSSLEGLWLQETSIGDEGVLVLTRASLPNLKALGLGERRWSEATLTALATSPNLCSLEHFHTNQPEAYGLLHRLCVDGVPLNPWAARCVARKE